MDLRSFVKCLEEDKALKIVRTPLSPDLEIPGVIAEFDKGPALFFNSIRGFEGFKAVGNVINTRDKLYRALGVKSDVELYKRLLWAEEVAQSYRPNETSNALFEPLPEVDLFKLPIPRYYPVEPRPYLSSAVVIGLERENGVLNASIHRLSVVDRDKLVIRLVPRHLHRIYEENKRRGEDTPIAIVWGVHPAILIAAASSPPYGVFELDIANALLNGSLKVVMLENGIPVPYDAEVVLEGRILKDSYADEGPFVDVLRLLDDVRPQPVIKVERVYVRRDDGYTLTHVLLPGFSEHRILMGIEKEAKIWQFVSNVVPEVKGVRLTDGGCGWLHAVIAVRKQTDGDPKNAIMAAFAAHPSLKLVVVVDDDVDIDDPNEVEWAIATRFRADEDLVIIKYARGSTLDPSSIDMTQGLTCKVGIDATRPLYKDVKKFEKVKPLKIDVRKIDVE